MKRFQGVLPPRPGCGAWPTPQSTAVVVAPPFVGLDWYHDARNASTLGVGASVPSLTDMTGNGRDVTEASGASQPLVVAGGGIHFVPSELH